jgi:hypothetical protein
MDRQGCGTPMLRCGQEHSHQAQRRRRYNVALSTAEAEFMALAASSQEAIYLRHLLPTLFGYPIICPIPTYEDNESGIDLATNDITTSKTKHIDIKRHYIRGIIKAPFPLHGAPHPICSRIF